MKKGLHHALALVLLAFNTTSIASEYAGEEVYGTLCNVLNTPSSEGARWSINLHDLDTGTNETVFGVTKNRKIQSVACSSVTEPMIFSMRETQTGDYEIYSYDSNSEEPLTQLTDNDTDDFDVTMSTDGQVFAYQYRLDDGRQAISLQQADGNGAFTEKTLASANPFVQPMLSDNGEWMVFVQLRPSFFAVMRYNVTSGTYTEVRKVPRRKKLYHPSVSGDGNIVGWTENKIQNRYLIKNIEENTVTQILNNLEGIEHGTLSSDGKIVAYSVNGETSRQIFITSLGTLETSSVGEALESPDRYLGVSLKAISSGSINTSKEELDLDRFVEGALKSAEVVDCTLSDGTETSCYQIESAGAPAGQTPGPFCPKTTQSTAEESGIWFHESGIDGIADLTGNFILDLPSYYGSTYTENMWKFYDDAGNVNITDTQEACEAAARPDVDPAYQNHCVECQMAYLDEDISTSYLIPVIPVPADVAGSVGQVGVALNGTELSAPAPVEDILSNYTIAAFDDCGGHINTNQGYHYHAATDCAAVGTQADSHSALLGYALDGYGIYAMRDSEGNEAIGLDECRGQTDDVRGYHYHAASPGENIFIGCFHGKTVTTEGGNGGPPGGGPPGGGPPNS